MNKTNSKYTYAMFAQDVIDCMKGNMTLTPERAALMLNKAEDLLGSQKKKAAYNAEHKSTKAPKGASAETQAKANAIASVLTTTPMTAAEISAAVGTEYTALQVANAVKYIKGANSCKVIRDTINSKGLKAQKEYTAYFIG